MMIVRVYHLLLPAQCPLSVIDIIKVGSCAYILYILNLSVPPYEKERAYSCSMVTLVGIKVFEVKVS